MTRFLGLLLALTAGLIGVLTGGTAGARTEDDGIISIGWTAWADAEIVSKLATTIIAQGMKKPVELTLSDIDVQYRNVAEGNLDLMMMSWQPVTHGDYIARYSADMVDLGTIYEDTKLGWAVPTYIPEEEVASVADLKRHRDKFAGRIVGIDPGAGLMKRTRGLIEDEALDGWTLEEGTGPLMAKKVIDANSKGEWIVATLWNPHWIFAEVDLRYLDDPEGVFGPAESVHVMARKGFEDDYPEVAAFIRRFSLEMEQLETLMADARKLGHKKAIYQFLEQNQDLVLYWVKGE